MGAFDNGVSLGYNAAQRDKTQKEARKQQLSALDLQTKYQDLSAGIQGNAANLAKLKASGKGPGTTEYDTANGQFQSMISERTKLFHPDSHPGALERLVGHLANDLHITHPMEPKTGEIDTTAPKISLTPGQAKDKMNPPPPPVPTTPADGPYIPQNVNMGGGPTEIPAGTPQVTQYQETPASPQQHENELIGQANIAAVPSASSANKFLDQKNNMIEAGLTAEQADHAIRIMAGVEAKPVATRDTIKGVPGTTPYQNKEGRWVHTLQHADGTSFEAELPEDYQPTARPGQLGSLASRIAGKYGPNATPEQMAAETQEYNNEKKYATQTTSTDAFGQTTTTSRTPTPLVRVAKPTSGSSNTAPIRTPTPNPATGKTASTTPQSPAMPSASPVPKKTPPRNLSETRQAVQAPAGAAPFAQLDEQGNIPAGYKANANLVSAANQLLHGADITKLPVPQKDRAAASALAAKFGYEPQGLFNPKENMQLRVATHFLTKAQNDPSFAVLDNPGSRAKIEKLLKDPDKEGFVSNLTQKAAAANLNPQEQAFIRTYVQLVGTITGLTQLVRSGKATESGIKRLITELPNPTNSTSAADAKQRIQNLMEEVQVAKDNGSIGAVTKSEKAAPASNVSDDEFLLNLGKK